MSQSLHRCTIVEHEGSFLASCSCGWWWPPKSSRIVAEAAVRNHKARKPGYRGETAGVHW